MGVFKRIFGICETRPPANQSCWRYKDGKVEIELAEARELKEKGGAIRLEGAGMPKRLLMVHGTDGGYHAFENKCTHFGRRLDPLPGQPQVRCCSVGKSTFNYKGDKVSGPAKGPVRTLKVEQRNGKLIILTE